jgi:ABC-type uncharacterized transport system permease subunit
MPAAVDTAGISVTWLRYRAVILTGVLTGVAGAYLSIAQKTGVGVEIIPARAASTHRSISRGARHVP